LVHSRGLEVKAGMSLTSYLDDKESQLARFFDGTFPNRQELLRRYRVDSPPLRVAPPVGTNPGTVGTAFDFLLRFELVPSPNLYLAMLGADLAGRKYVALLDELVDRLGCTVRETAVGSTSEADVVSAPPRRDTELVCRGSYVAALLAEVYRSGDVWPGSLLSQVTKRTTLDQILELVPDIAVADLEAMLDVARDKLVPAVRARGGPLWLGPVFDGSQWVPADADIIAAGLLIDVKTGAGSKRKDGSRYNGLDKQTLYQLLGYLLFDFSDTYGIREVGLYAARYGQLTTWPVVDLLQELAPEPVTLADLRERCAAVVKEPAARGHQGASSGG
jgi:hypothetical protein